MRELTPLQMKIEVENQLQRLGSNRRDPLQDELIMWRLNTAQDRVITYRINPRPNNPRRFEVNAKYTGDLQKIIIPNYTLTSIVEPNEYRCVYGNLPSDFAYLINDRSRVVADCEDGFATAKESFTDRVLVYGFPDSSLGAAPFYKELTITVGEVVTTIPCDGFKSKKEKFQLIDIIINKFNTLGYPTYWEEFGSLYYPGSFLISTSNTSPIPTLKIDGTAVGVSPVDTSKERYKKFSGRESYQNRLIKEDYLHTALQGNYYERPIPNSPVSALARNKLFVYHTERFIISEIIIDYIRKPRRISLPLNISCELPGTVHEEICSVAAEMILGNIEAPPYTLKVQENVTRTE